MFSTCLVRGPGQSGREQDFKDEKKLWNEWVDQTATSSPRLDLHNNVGVAH